MKLEDIDIKNTKIETASLILRPFEEGDLDDFYAYTQVPGVGEAAGWKHHESKEEAAAVLKRLIEEHRTFAITEKIGGKVIGSVGLEPSSEVYRDTYLGYNTNDIGYILAKDYWGKGYALEVIRAIMSYAFYVLHLEALTCAHFEGNKSSQEIIEKCGFKLVCKDKYTTESGETHNALFYAITHREYGVEYTS